MQREQWLPVVGWEGIYEVSSLGRLRRVVGGKGTSAGRIVLGSLQKGGYRKVRLSYRGRVANPWVHQVVARAFLGPCPEGHEVNHKDLNPANNAASNFEYLTHRENIQHAADGGAMPRGEAVKSAVLSAEKVRVIWQRRADGWTVREIAEALGVNKDTVFSVTQGRSWRWVRQEMLAS